MLKLYAIRTSINDPYVDGLSVTYTSNNTREHIWTLMTDFQHTDSRCPCRSDLVHYRTPSFVGNDYYCELLNNLDNNSLLWDGEGCSDVFANSNLPWFCREFDQPIVTDNIEVRVCTDEIIGNEDIYFDLLKIYIQQPHTACSLSLLPVMTLFRLT